MGNTSSAHSRVDVDAVVPHDPDKVSLWTPTEEESKKLKTAKTRKQIKNFAKQKIYFDVSPKMIDMGLYGRKTDTETKIRKRERKANGPNEQKKKKIKITLVSLILTFL